MEEKYSKGKYICYSRKVGTQTWKICKYPRWFSIHEYKLELKIIKVEPFKCQEAKEQWQDSFAKLDRASL